MKNLGKSEGDIDCIPNNEEKYISFSKKIQVGTYLDKDKNEKPILNEMRFLDSAKFMASSLDSLVKNLGKEKLYNVRREFGGKTDLSEALISEKVFILMIIWIALINSLKKNFLQKKNFSID